MIVRCERCETRFKLDESRIPARGARVRCSRCKHAFFVTPPGATPEAVVHEVAAEAARSERAKPPEPSWDLEDGPDATIARARPAPAAASEPADDTDWRFEDDVPGLDPGATRASFDATGAQTAPSLALPDRNESSFADLGDPETWDLLAGDPPPAPAAPPPIAPVEPDLAEVTAPSASTPVLAEPASVPEPASAPAPMAPARVAPPMARSAFAPPAVVMPRHIPAAPRASGIGTWAGWAGLAALVAAIAVGVVWPAQPPARATSLPPVAGFEVAEARARVIENAAAGPVLVISGRLRNPGPAPRALGALPAVQLLDGAGAPLGVADAGPALSETLVREERPERLAAAQREAAVAFARAPVAAGGELEFTALFAPVPRGAEAFALAPGGAR